MSTSAVRTCEHNVINWASQVDDATLAQARRTAALPIVAGPVALMADAHVGVGATVGSVVVTSASLIPAAVGVDLGCGMIAVETDLVAADLPTDRLTKLHSRIGATVPAGVGRGHERRNSSHHEAVAAHRDIGTLVGWQHAPELTDRQREVAIAQFGSLGSGNHFVEICLDEAEHVWVLLHSGSRGIGNQLASAHIASAKADMARHLDDPLEDPDLAWVVEGTEAFEAYVKAMLWAQDYAAGNRERMMDSVLTELFGAVGHGGQLTRVNCHHNYCVRETHRCGEVWVTRKGAIRAGTGQLGLIPGSMGTRSYVVEGLGNETSYESCSHGAGRRLSRTQARKTLDVETFVAGMTGKVWDSSRASERGRGALIEEDPRAYKDIDQVMADQADLVTVRHTLTQVLNYKG